MLVPLFQPYKCTQLQHKIFLRKEKYPCSSHVFATKAAERLTALALRLTVLNATYIVPLYPIAVSKHHYFNFTLLFLSYLI